VVHGVEIHATNYITTVEAYSVRRPTAWCLADDGTGVYRITNLSAATGDEDDFGKGCMTTIDNEAYVSYPAGIIPGSLSPISLGAN